MRCEIRKPRGETGSLQMKCCSKKKYARQEDEGKASTEFTFYDQYGMLRKGLVTDDGLAHNRDEELERILSVENSWGSFSEEEKRTWYIVESGWIRTWLSYVRYGTASLGESLSSPAPGPVNNECLLLMTADTDSPIGKDGAPLFRWAVKSGLVAAGKTGQGHFRRINCRAWAAYCEMYKGSGPAIKYVEEMPPVPEAVAEEKPGDSKAEERGGTKEGEVKEVTVVDPTRWQDSSLWVVDQDQDRFKAKYNEKHFPQKSPEQRLQLMHAAWESKKLKKKKLDKENEAAALETAASAEIASAKQVEEAADVLDEDIGGGECVEEEKVAEAAKSPEEYPITDPQLSSQLASEKDLLRIGVGSNEGRH